ncbi:MAG: glycosyltransferase family 2 protein [candidate division NC10 bacterium]|nr:glycosyltransferase family 2 protein [candidate division NC10 bacterium]MDE2321230.1 glycosyltransferase family 2 protein [candidate division NC10 bacterium]
MSKSIGSAIALSVVVPVFNEEANLSELYERLTKTLDGLGSSYEIIFVDDGCTDGSSQRLRELAAGDPRVRAVRFVRNFGQHAALSAGIERSRGDIVILMDADLQSDPEEVPRFISKIGEGCDLVTGWRADRQDLGIARRIGSAVMNKLVSLSTGATLHDHGCGFRAMTRRVAQEINRSGDLRRFLAVRLVTAAHAVGEVPIANHARRRGQSKYTPFRLLALTFELLLVVSAGSFRIIGCAGILGALVGGLVACGALLGRLAFGMVVGPFVLVAILFLVLGGVQFTILGLLGEFVVRGYHAAQALPFYVVEEEIGGAAGAKAGLG